LTALVAAATLAIRIPIPATQGYINVGDAVILVAALLGGGRLGGIAGGVGSALADVYGGYSHWAPFTLAIKGLEGWMVGAWASRLRPDLQRFTGLAIAAGLGAVGLAWMVVGYFLVEWWLYSLGPALGSLLGNAVQAAASLVAGLPLAAALQRTGILRRPA
jgi:uncharacterized membrane protein